MMLLTVPFAHANEFIWQDRVSIVTLYGLLCPVVLADAKGGRCGCAHSSSCGIVSGKMRVAAPASSSPSTVMARLSTHGRDRSSLSPSGEISLLWRKSLALDLLMAVPGDGQLGLCCFCVSIFPSLPPWDHYFPSAPSLPQSCQEQPPPHLRDQQEKSLLLTSIPGYLVPQEAASLSYEASHNGWSNFSQPHSTSWQMTRFPTEAITLPRSCLILSCLQRLLVF